MRRNQPPPWKETRVRTDARALWWPQTWCAMFVRLCGVVIASLICSGRERYARPYGRAPEQRPRKQARPYGRACPPMVAGLLCRILVGPCAVLIPACICLHGKRRAPVQTRVPSGGHRLALHMFLWGFTDSSASWKTGVGCGEASLHGKRRASAHARLPSGSRKVVVSYTCGYLFGGY